MTNNIPLTPSEFGGNEENTYPLATMWRRLGAYIIDELIVTLPIIVLGFLLFVPYKMSFISTTYTDNYEASPTFNYSDGLSVLVSFLPILLIISLVIGEFLFTAICMWATNGYTPGKWLLKIRVEKFDKSKITFMEAFVRETIVKGIANTMLSGCLNIISFVWGLMTPEKKTIQDLVVSTKVIEVVKN